MLEGLGQALPLFATPDDKLLATRVRIDHYTQLVRAALHIALGTGASIIQCADYARAHVPFWTDADIADFLTDRGADPLLRSYLWSYPAGIDWFSQLAAAPAEAQAQRPGSGLPRPADTEPDGGAVASGNSVRRTGTRP